MKNALQAWGYLWRSIAQSHAAIIHIKAIYFEERAQDLLAQIGIVLFGFETPFQAIHRIGDHTAQFATLVLEFAVMRQDFGDDRFVDLCWLETSSDKKLTPIAHRVQSVDSF